MDLCPRGSPITSFPKRAPSTPQSPACLHPLVCFILHIHPHHLHTYFYLFPLCLSPLTRMQAPWGRGFLSVWVTSACPVPGMGAEHTTQSTWCIGWIGQACWGIWEENTRLQPAPPSPQWCTDVSPEQQQPFCQWDISQLQAGADTRKNRVEKGKKPKPQRFKP